MIEELVYYGEVSPFDIYAQIINGRFVAVEIGLDPFFMEEKVGVYELKVAKIGKNMYRLCYDRKTEYFKQAPKGKRYITSNEGHNCWSHPPLVGYPRRNEKGEIVLDVEINNELIEFKRIFECGNAEQHHKLIRTTFVIHDYYEKFEMEDKDKIDEA